MLEQTIEIKQQHYIFRPHPDEQSDLFTNQDVVRFATNKFCRYELIGGEIIVSTAPRYIHQLLSTKIIGQFLKSLDANPIGEILATPGLIFSKFDGVIPDLIFITHARREQILNKKDGKFHGAPELVIEILSPGRANARRDLEIKRELYDYFEVAEYWVVSPHEKTVTVFKRQSQELQQVRVYQENEQLEFRLLSDFKLNLENLFAG